MKKFTKGPWHSKAMLDINGNPCVLQMAGSEGKHIAAIYEARGLGFEAEGNRKLRDAAPDMLKALEETYAWMGDQWRDSAIGRNIKEAISKAKGE